ncbi:MAG: helix-turn-helix domain-containing protein [Phycisphaerales bacterium]
MTQQELSDLTGVLPHRISEYLSGKRDVYAETLQRILEVLDFEIRAAPRRRKGK